MLAQADFDAVPSRGTDLSGRWQLNVDASEDPEQALQERLEEEWRRYARWRRAEELERRARNLPPEPGTMERPPAHPERRMRPWQRRQLESFRKMLAITSWLEIRQSGSEVEIVSDVESRRFEGGSRTHVSMPEGQLAEQRVGWDGDRFVIERRVRRGPRIIEKYRLLEETSQLEYVLTVGGETELAGIKLKRIFDRAPAEAPPPDPDVGPVYR